MAHSPGASRPVVVLTRHLNAQGGVTRSVSTLVNGLAAEGLDVRLLVLFRRGPVRYELDPRVEITYVRNLRPKALTKLGPKRRRLDEQRGSLCDDAPPMSALTDRMLRRHLRDLPPCTVISHRPVLHQAVARWAPGHVSHLAVEHTSLDERENRGLRGLTEALPTMDRLVVLTEENRAAWLELLAERGLSEHASKVVVVPNAVPLAMDRAVGSYAARTVVAAGSLIPRKGFDHLVRAYAPLAREFPDWRLRIFGGGQDEAALRALVAELGVGEAVDLAGFTSTLHDEMAASSVYAITSSSEGLPMVMLEAMSLGLPVAAFDCIGVRDLVSPGRTGLMVDQGDDAALTDALRRLMGDEDLRREMGTAGRAMVQDYAPGRVMAQWRGLLDDVAPGPAG